MPKKVLLLAFLAILAGCAPAGVRQATLNRTIAEKALAAAESVEGAPYQEGGQGPDRFDCSGLVIWAYQLAYPRLGFWSGNAAVDDVDANTLWEYNVERIDYTRMRPGDLIFMSSAATCVNHVGLFVGWEEGRTAVRTIEASRSRGAVAYFTRPLAGYPGFWLVGAGRLRTVY